MSAPSPLPDHWQKALCMARPKEMLTKEFLADPGKYDVACTSTELLNNKQFTASLLNLPSATSIAAGSMSLSVFLDWIRTHVLDPIWVHVGTAAYRELGITTQNNPAITADKSLAPASKAWPMTALDDTSNPDLFLSKFQRMVDDAWAVRRQASIFSTGAATGSVVDVDDLKQLLIVIYRPYVAACNMMYGSADVHDGRKFNISFYTQMANHTNLLSQLKQLHDYMIWLLPDAQKADFAAKVPFASYFEQQTTVVKSLYSKGLTQSLELANKTKAMSSDLYDTNVAVERRRARLQVLTEHMVRTKKQVNRSRLVFYLWVACYLVVSLVAIGLILFKQHTAFYIVSGLVCLTLAVLFVVRLVKSIRADR